MKENKISQENYVMKDDYDFSNAVRGRFYKPSKKSTTIKAHQAHQGRRILRLVHYTQRVVF